MTRAHAAVAAFLPVVSAAVFAGSSWPSGDTADVVQRQRVSSLRGSRRRTTSEPPTPPAMCSSIGCPDGYIPIPNHDTTECPGGDCTVEACCEAMCACYGCPHHYLPIESEAQELCHGGVCTTEQCCEPARPTCSSIGCPDGYTPIPGHYATECPDRDCTVDVCCEAMCAGYGCPNNYTPIESEAQVLCHGGVCTTEQCCETGAATPAEPDYDNCSSVQCPSETHRPIEAAEEKRCRTADFMAPTPAPRDGGGSYAFDYELSSDEWDDYLAGYSYSFGYSTGEEGGMALDGGSHWDGAEEEYCDLSTCCEEKEYGIWGLE